VPFYKVDIRDREGLSRVFALHNFDCCIHFAGLKAVGESVEKPWEYYENNIGGTLVLLDVMRKHGCKSIIFSSSATVYGNPAEMPITEACPKGHCTNPYGQTKSMLEEILIDMHTADVKLMDPKPWNVVLKASVARNYRYPTMDDLYFQPGGNPDLQPEKGFTYDMGVEFAVKKRCWSLKGNMTAFDSHIKDWILWTPNTKGFWEPSNVKKVHNYGLECSLDGSLLLTKDMKVSLTGNFAWTPSKNIGEDINSNDASYGKQLCYVPKTSANLNARIQWRTWTLLYQWNHYSERYTTTSNEVNYITGRLKPYYMTDLSLEKTFRWLLADWSVKGVINNLYSTEYVTVLSRPMPRRNYEIYLTLKL
jgi:hypothetical protein